MDEIRKKQKLSALLKANSSEKGKREPNKIGKYINLKKN